MKQVIKYQSSDGKLWDDSGECREHELAVSINEQLISNTDICSGSSLYEIVRALIRKGHIELPEA